MNFSHVSPHLIEVLKFEKWLFGKQMGNIGIGFPLMLPLCFLGGRKAKREKKTASLNWVPVVPLF